MEASFVRSRTDASKKRDSFVARIALFQIYPPTFLKSSLGSIYPKDSLLRDRPFQFYFIRDRPFLLFERKRFIRGSERRRVHAYVFD